MRISENQKTKDRGVRSNVGEYSEVDIPPNSHIIPGFIDVHIHGINGSDTMDASKEALDVMTSTLPGEGTTSFLVTTITQESRRIENALINAGKYIQTYQDTGRAEILGIHLEGPFVSEKWAGVQPRQYIIDPDLYLFKRWQSLSDGTLNLLRWLLKGLGD